MVTDSQILFIEPAYASEIKTQLQSMDAADVTHALQTVDLSNNVRIAVIPIHGYLIHRSDYHVPGYLTGYGFIQKSVIEAENDPSISGIAFDVNSGGGMVNGAFEAAQVIADAKKPTIAIVDSSAYSAAYLMSSAADKIVISKTGGAGSIGVVTTHVNYGKMLGDVGIEVTMLYAGKQKVDGNPYEALSEDARARIQSKLEASYELFVNTVADYRDMSATDIKNTEAGTYQGDKAVEVGLVDAVMPPVEAYAAFADELSKNTDGGMGMDKQTQASASNDNEAEVKATNNVAKQEGAAAERGRISTILGSEEANDRTDLAKHLAFNTDMSAEAAIGILAASAKQTVEKDDKGDVSSENAFDAAMAQSNPEIQHEAEQEEVSTSDSMLSLYNNVTGHGVQ